MTPYERTSVSNYLAGVYAETRYKLHLLDIEWQIEPNRIVIKANAPVYAQIKPFIDSQCTIYMLKATKTTRKGRITLVLTVENTEKLFVRWGYRTRIGDLDPLGGSVL